MSKCREAYEQYQAESWMYAVEASAIWQAAWNARGEVDAEIAYEALDDPFLSGHGYATNVKEAIEKENEQ